MVAAKVTVSEAMQYQQLDAWMDYRCYWIEGLETEVCNLQGFIKHPSDVPLEYSLENATGADSSIVNVQMLNMHEGGMVFGACSPVAIGVGIHIRVNVQGTEVSLRGVVTHCFQLDDSHYDVGVQFGEVDQHHAMRIVEQACHIEHYRKAWSLKGRDLSEDEAAKEWIARFAATFPK